MIILGLLFWMGRIKSEVYWSGAKSGVVSVVRIFFVYFVFFRNKYIRHWLEHVYILTGLCAILYQSSLLEPAFAASPSLHVYPPGHSTCSLLRLQIILVVLFKFYRLIGIFMV